VSETVVLVGLETDVPSGRKTGVDVCWKKKGRLNLYLWG